MITVNHSHLDMIRNTTHNMTLHLTISYIINHQCLQKTNHNCQPMLLHQLVGRMLIEDFHNKLKRIVKSKYRQIKLIKCVILIQMIPLKKKYQQRN